LIKFEPFSDAELRELSAFIFFRFEERREDILYFLEDHFVIM
jgi:hypothetical protein